MELCNWRKGRSGVQLGHLCKFFFLCLTKNRNLLAGTSKTIVYTNIGDPELPEKQALFLGFHAH